MSIIRSAALVLALVVLSAASAEATQRTVCASGCTFTNSQLQSAINAAVAGDEVLLQTNFTYVGTFHLPTFSCAAGNATCFITIRTGVTSVGAVMASSSFPAVNIRITPTYSSVLAKLQTSVNNSPALDTTGIAAWWRVKWLEFLPNTYGGGSLLEMGTGDVATKADRAHDLEVVQVYAHGDPVRGQFRGISVFAPRTTVKDSYVSDIKSTSEGQSFYSHASDDLLVTNNYFEGGSEVSIIGGSNGCCVHSRTVAASPAPTVNSATFDSVDDLEVGQGMSVQTTVAGVPAEAYVEVLTINTSTKAVTWTPDLDVLPDVPGDVDYGVVPKNMTFTKNVYTRPVSHRNPIVGTPQSVSAEALETGGTLAAGTYAYRIVARHPINIAGTARSTASAEVTATITGTTGSVKVTWSPVTNATEYLAYGRNVGGETIFWNVGSATTFTDTGGAGSAGSVPTSTGTVWQVKNVFELKTGINVLVEGNVMENTWNQAQTGTAIVLTVANTSCGNDSTRLSNVTFRNNIIRHAAGGLSLPGRGDQPCPTGRHVGSQITNNLFYDISTFWGAGLRFLLIGPGSPSPEIYQNLDTEPNTIAPKDLVIEHNTVDEISGNAMMFLNMSRGGDRKVENFTFRNNITNRVDNGVYGNASCKQGSDCWTRYTTGTVIWDKNVVTDAACAAYPAGTFCPTRATLQNSYVSYAAQNFQLKTTSPYHNAATDGTDIGANIVTLEALTNIALTGDNTGGPPILTPPTITTVTLPAGQVSTTYAAILTATDCGVACTWSLVSGSLPTGVSLATNGVISGVPTTPVSALITIRATASNGQTAQGGFTIEIVDTSSEDPNSRPRCANYVCNGIFVDPEEPVVAPSGNGARTYDFWGDQTSGVWKWLCSTAPAPKWCEFVQKIDGNAIGSLGAAGTPSSLTFLRGDNTWAVPPGGGSSAAQLNNLMFATPSSASVNWGITTSVTELFGAARNRLQFDLTGFAQCRIYIKFTTAIVGATATIWPQWSTDNGSTWNDLGTTAQTPAIDATSTTGITKSAFVTIATGAKTDVQLRVVGIATASPSTQPNLGNVGMNCK